MQQSGGIPKQEWKPSLQPWSLLIHLRRPAGVCHSSSVTKKKQSLRTMCGGGRKWYSCRLYNDPLLGHGCGAHLTLGGGVLIETEPEASASERYLRCLLLPSVITCQLPFQTWQLTVETSKTKSQRFS